MDVGTFFGLSLAGAMIATSIYMGGGNYSAFWDGTSLLVVLGGTIGALLVCFPLKTVMRGPRIVTKTIFHEPPNYGDLIQQIVALAAVARRDGLLALEKKLGGISDPFVRLGLQWPWMARGRRLSKTSCGPRSIRWRSATRKARDPRPAGRYGVRHDRHAARADHYAWQHVGPLHDQQRHGGRPDDDAVRRCSRIFFLRSPKLAYFSSKIVAHELVLRGFNDQSVRTPRDRTKLIRFCPLGRISRQQVQP
jgi:hypothetical protein